MHASAYRKEIRAFINGLPEGARVLDIGCGSGKTLRLIRQIRSDLHLEGIDIEDTSAILPDDTNFTKGSVDDLLTLYKPASFDAVVCQHVLEHLLNPTPCIRGVQHILKPGGAIFLETPNWIRLFLPFSHLWFWNDYTHIRPSSRWTLWRLFTDHGLITERLVTASTCTWTTTPTSRPIKTGPALPAFPQRLVSRIAARLINPLAHDVVIGIARKPH